MVGVSKETDSSGETESSKGSYRTVEEVVGILDPKLPLLGGLKILEASNPQTLETLFRRPGRRGSRIPGSSL